MSDKLQTSDIGCSDEQNYCFVQHFAVQLKLMEKPCRVWVTKFAEKQIRKLPKHIAAAYHTWVKTVELDGLRITRTLPGYHDEPLRGDRHGQRSVRLSRAYRVIYEETEAGNVVLVGIQEVNKHDY